MRLIGTTSYNGYPRPMRERLRLIADAGFTSVMLWWGNGEPDPRTDRFRYAREYGLTVEPVHGDFDELNPIWLPDGDCSGVLAELRAEIEDCARTGAGPLVLHVTCGSAPPPVSEAGLERFGSLITLAERLGVRLAFENIRSADHLRAVLDMFPSSAAGLCWDNGHERIWTPGIDFCSLYGDRLFAVHLDDNNLQEDLHLIPFDGTVDWDVITARLAETGYRGPVNLEAEYLNCGHYDALPIEEFLDRTFRAARTLEAMLEKASVRLGGPLKDPG